MVEAAGPVVVEEVEEGKVEEVEEGKIEEVEEGKVEEVPAPGEDAANEGDVYAGWVQDEHGEWVREDGGVDAQEDEGAEQNGMGAAPIDIAYAEWCCAEPPHCRDATTIGSDTRRHWVQILKSEYFQNQKEPGMHLARRRLVRESS